MWDCFLQYSHPKDDLIEYKCVCPTKNYQQKFDKKFDSLLNMKLITDADYAQAKRVCKYFQIENIMICMFKVTYVLKAYELDPVIFFQLLY